MGTGCGHGQLWLKSSPPATVHCPPRCPHGTGRSDPHLALAGRWPGPRADGSTPYPEGTRPVVPEWPAHAVQVGWGELSSGFTAWLPITTGLSPKPTLLMGSPQGLLCSDGLRPSTRPRQRAADGRQHEEGGGSRGPAVPAAPVPPAPAARPLGMARDGHGLRPSTRVRERRRSLQTCCAPSARTSVSSGCTSVRQCPDSSMVLWRPPRDLCARLSH